MKWVKQLLGLKEERQKALVTVQPDDARPGSSGRVSGKQVTIWSPPIRLDGNGNTQAGISKELIATYLVATTSALAGQDLGEVSVRWRQAQGRFATTTLSVHAWEVDIDLLMPIAAISEELHDTLRDYREGITHKVKQLHRGLQSYDEANTKIRQALQRLAELRSADRPHFNNAEYLFLVSELSRSLTLSALVPTPIDMRDEVFEDDGEAVPEPGDNAHEEEGEAFVAIGNF